MRWVFLSISLKTNKGFYAGVAEWLGLFSPGLFHDFSSQLREFLREQTIGEHVPKDFTLLNKLLMNMLKTTLLIKLMFLAPTQKVTIYTLPLHEYLMIMLFQALLMNSDW